MIDTDKYENMRRLFLDFIDTVSDEVDEEAWKDKLTMLDELWKSEVELLAELRRLRKRNEWLEEVVALLQEDGIDLSMEGYPLWEGEEE